MKKGFTLIELLAVIIILAIILVIAIPSISSLIEDTQITSLKNNNQMLLKAAKIYAGVDESVLPVNIGDTTEITLSTLQTNNYISAIKNPADKNQDCNGYVIITKIDNSNYDYTPHLNCLSNISNSTEDDLVAHYKFDDFQEPTENLITSPNSNNVISTDIPYEALTSGVTGYSSYSSGYGVYNRSTISTSGINTFTFTAWLRSPSATKSTYLIYVYTGVGGDGGWQHFGSGSLTDQWQKISSTRTLTGGTVTSVLIYRLNQLGTIEICAPQLEIKPYATPFVIGTRLGVVKDYSSNGNHVNLQLNSTPKWVESSKIGKGGYLFNGTTNYIDLAGGLNTFGNTGDFTMSAWIKSSTTTRTGVVTSGYSSAGVGRYGLYSDGVYVRDSSNNHIYANYSQYLNNEWSHIVGVFDRTNGKITFFVNGVQRATNTWNGTLASGSSGILSIGNLQRPSGTSDYYFQGLIDDVYLYDRIVSPEEIRWLYETTK